MPWAMKKVKGGFKVFNTDTMEVKAEKTTREDAEAQIRLLNAAKQDKKADKKHMKEPVEEAK